MAENSTAVFHMPSCLQQASIKHSAKYQSRISSRCFSGKFVTVLLSATSGRQARSVSLTDRTRVLLPDISVPLCNFDAFPQVMESEREQ